MHAQMAVVGEVAQHGVGMLLILACRVVSSGIMPAMCSPTFICSGDFALRRFRKRVVHPDNG